MKKTLSLLLCAILALASFPSCSSEKETSENGELQMELIGSEIVTNEPEYEWELKDYQVIAPENQEEYKPISDDAIAKNYTEITNLQELVAGYEGCYNYGLSYDESIIFSGNGNYYLVTDEAQISAFKAECAKYFAEGVYPTCVTERDGNLYYKPVMEKIALTLDIGEDGDGINYSDNLCCELTYNSESGECHYIEFSKNESGFIIVSSFVE